MEPVPTKEQKVLDALSQAKQAAEIGKAIVPGKAGRVIDKGEQIIDDAATGISVFEKFRSIFKRKNK